MKGERIRWISLIFLLVMGSSIASIAYADPGTLVYVDPALTECFVPCESFDVNITIADVVDLYSWTVKLGFDGNVLTVTNVTEGPFLEGQPGGTFFIKKIYTHYIDTACTTLGSYPGVSGSGVLMTVTFHVKDTGDSDLDIYDDVLVDSTLTAIAHDTADGYFHGCLGLADLVRKSAWPAHHHFVLSKHGSNQTLYGKVKNLAPMDLYVKVMFEIVRDDGYTTSVETDPAKVTPDTVMDLMATLGPLTDLDTGRYSVNASCLYSYSGTYWHPLAQGEKIKAFSFAVVL